MITSAPLPKTRRPSAAPVAVLNRPLRRLLTFILVLTGLLVIDSLYLVSITITERIGGEGLQNFWYLTLFLGHLLLGLVLIPPFLIFGLLHLRRAWRRPNRYAKRAGLGLYLSAIALIVSGVLLTRFGFFEINDPGVRSVAYWVHVLAPLIVVWLFVLHRLAGPRLKWRGAGYWAATAITFTVVAVGLHLINKDSASPLQQALAPALVLVDGNRPIPQHHLMQDDFCAECHADIAQQHAGSMHRLSSFNNPAYRFSIEDTRRILLERDGDVRVARLCAVCHDPAPLFSGRFDDPAYDPDLDPGSQAGLTCLACHAIDTVNGPHGNGDFTLTDPKRYPFAFSENTFLKAVNRQLIKAKPAYHKATLLKPFHKDAEFCSICHKVHLPPELNHYRWLRGQDHYDSFLLSGVSGHRVDSFYYPPRARHGCTDCHMPPAVSNDPAARELAEDAPRSVHDHLFAAANTAVPWMTDNTANNGARTAMMQGSARVDLFALREGGSVDGALLGPLRPALPELEPGGQYLLETVIRTTGIGHALTQGTSDSNELWLEVVLKDGERIIGRSGGVNERLEVDPWSYFINTYMLDKDGKRIDRRNAQDIVVALYNHQIPPGAASVTHYGIRLPDELQGPITLEARLHYRKFDSRFYAHVRGDAYTGNDLPVTTMAVDRVVLPVAGGESVSITDSPIPGWERWNDYGIGLLRESLADAKSGGLRQAADAFERVEALGRSDGPMNLTRVLFQEGRLDDAAAALARAETMEPPAPPWTRAWYSARIKREFGDLDGAIADLTALAETRFQDARDRGFDFSRDYRMLNELARTLYERARYERGEQRRAARIAILLHAKVRLDQVLAEDPEYASAHHNLSLVLNELGNPDLADKHRTLHEHYRSDDNIVEWAVSRHRSSTPAADHAASVPAIYDLQRPDNVYLGSVPPEPSEPIAIR